MFLMAKRTSHQASHDKHSSGRVLVVDPNPITLVAMAGVLDSEGFACMCARTHNAALKAVQEEPHDLVVCDVADDAQAALDLLCKLREHDGMQSLGAVLIADARWSGLESKTERLPATHCLFKPIDPKTLLAVVDQAMWMPHLVETHRRRGTRPSRPGWVTLD